MMWTTWPKANSNFINLSLENILRRLSMSTLSVLWYALPNASSIMQLAGTISCKKILALPELNICFLKLVKITLHKNDFIKNFLGLETALNPRNSYRMSSQGSLSQLLQL